MNKLNRDIQLFLISKGHDISQIGGVRRPYELIYKNFNGSTLLIILNNCELAYHNSVISKIIRNFD